MPQSTLMGLQFMCVGSVYDPGFLTTCVCGLQSPTTNEDIDSEKLPNWFLAHVSQLCTTHPTSKPCVWLMWAVYIYTYDMCRMCMCACMCVYLCILCSWCNMLMHTVCLYACIVCTGIKESVHYAQCICSRYKVRMSVHIGYTHIHTHCIHSVCAYTVCVGASTSYTLFLVGSPSSLLCFHYAMLTFCLQFPADAHL